MWTYRERLNSYEKLRRSLYEILRDTLEARLMKISLIDSFYNFLKNDWSLTIVYRTLNETNSSENGRFGILTTEVVSEIQLYSTTLHRPSPKVKAKYGVVEDATLIAILATQELEDRHVTLQRESGAMYYEGQEYEIMSIDPRPPMFSSSIATVVSCRERKPLDG